MTNMFSNSSQDKERVETPLLGIDKELMQYAAIHGMKLSKNYHNWPERSLTWGRSIQRLIQIYLEDAKTLSFNFWICASQDRGSERFWKNQFLKRAVPFLEIERNLGQLLEEGRALAESWTEKDLQSSKIAKSI